MMNQKIGKTRKREEWSTKKEEKLPSLMEEKKTTSSKKTLNPKVQQSPRRNNTDFLPRTKMIDYFIYI